MCKAFAYIIPGYINYFCFLQLFKYVYHHFFKKTEKTPQYLMCMYYYDSLPNMHLEYIQNERSEGNQINALVGVQLAAEACFKNQIRI